LSSNHSSTRAVAVLTCLSVSGCSFIFSEGPPPSHERLPYFDCSTSYAPPVLDTIWAGLNGLGAAVAAGQSDAEWKQNNSSDRGTVVGVGLVWLAVSGASAIYGYNKVAACHEAKEKLMLRTVRPAGAIQAWPPPPGTPQYPYPPPGYPPPGYPPVPPPTQPAPPPAQPAPPAQPGPPAQPAPPAQQPPQP
jgi:hypothetical protein